MARLQLDNLIFSLPAVETSHRRGSDQPLDADAFQRQLQKAGDRPAPQDRASSTTTTPTATERKHSQRDSQSQSEAPSNGPPTETRQAAAKSKDEHDPHDDADQDSPKNVEAPVEQDEQKPDKDVAADQFPTPAAAVVVPAVAAPLQEVKDVAVTEPTVTKAPVDPQQAQLAPGVAKTATAKQVNEKPATGGTVEIKANAVASEEVKTATLTTAVINPETQQSTETDAVNPVKGKSDQEHADVSEHVNPELPVEVGQAVGKQDEQHTEDKQAPVVRTSHRQNNDGANLAQATSVPTPSPAAVANAPAQIQGAPTSSAVPNATPAAIAVANQPANVRSLGNNGPPLIGDQPVRTGVSSGSRTTTTEKSAGLTQGERVRLVQRVSRAFHSIGENGGQLRLRLSPAELGSLKLEITFKDGTLTARMETETDAARNLLVEHLPQLRERLAEQGIKIERFDIDLMNQSSGGPSDNTGDRANQGQSGTDAARGNMRTSAPNAVATESAARPRAAENSELDVLI